MSIPPGPSLSAATTDQVVSSSPNTDPAKDNATSASESKIHRCKCNRDFKSHSGLDAHIQQYGDDGKGNQYHKASKLNSLPVERRRESPANPENWANVYECEWCDQIFNNANGLSFHKHKAHRDEVGRSGSLSAYHNQR